MPYTETVSRTTLQLEKHIDHINVRRQKLSAERSGIMKIIITIVLFSFSGFKSFSQARISLYKGLERICWINESGELECYDAPKKWYYESSLLIDKDSFFIYKVPVQIVGKKKIYSAADGGFYYYFGKTQQTDTGTIVKLIMNNCDYCAHSIEVDTVTGFMFPVAKVESYKVTAIPNGVRLGNVSYYRNTVKNDYFPAR